MTGYYSGFLDATSKLQQMSDAEAQRQQTLQQTNIQKANFDNQQADRIKQQQQQAQEAKIASDVFTSGTGERLGQEKTSSLDEIASKYQEMAQKLSPIDPEASNKYFKMSLDVKSKSQTMQRDALAIQAHKLTNIADLAAGVGDQQSLNEAIPEFAKLGVIIPDSFKQYNPASSEWFKSKAMQSSKFIAATKVQSMQDRIDFMQNEKQLADERANKRIAQKDSQIALEREKIDRGSIKTPAYQKTTEKQLDNSVSYLSEKYPNFADADEETQKQAAEDVIPKTVEYMKTLGIPQDQAKKMALEHIAKSIDNEGVYNPTPVVSTKAPTNKPIVGGETRMINGANYTKVPGGWKKIN